MVGAARASPTHDATNRKQVAEGVEVNIRDFEYFVAVAEYGSFRAAAEQCGVSQPTISAQIRRLEKEIGATLLQRSAGGSHLSPVGELALPHAREIVAQAEMIRRLATKSAKSVQSGKLRLGVFPTLAPYLLPHLVPALHRSHPKLQLVMSDEVSAQLLDHLAAGKLDCVLLAEETKQNGLTSVDLFTEDFVLALPVGHALAGESGAIGIDQLAGVQVLMLSDGHCLREQTRQLCRSVGAREIRGYSANSIETLRSMVLAGAGVALLPSLALAANPATSSQGLVVRRFLPPVPNRLVSLVYPSTSPLLPVILELGDILRTLPTELQVPGFHAV